MNDPASPFDDGAAYERRMGVWSRSAGDAFLEWLAPHPGLRWIDVGCGGGAFTARLIEICAPSKVRGIDPSAAQIAFARARPDAALAQFHQGDAVALPFADASFDVAVMALVIFFIPDPAAGVAEMARVTAPGGLVAAYTWDISVGGSPLDPVRAELTRIGVQPPTPPRAEVAKAGALRDLWASAGLDDVATREIVVTRTFADFNDFWAITALTEGPLRQVIESLPAGEVEAMQRRLRTRLSHSSDGRITQTARANAVRGRRPG